MIRLSCHDHPALMRHPVVAAAIVSLGISRLALAQRFVEFPVPTVDSRPGWITPGPDGNMWFTEGMGNRIGRITPAGAITEFLIPTADSGPSGIVAGPDGNLWFTEYTANKIGRVSPAGVFQEYVVPTADARPFQITVGPDGALWFSEGSGANVGRITTAGLITEFAVTSVHSIAGIASGSDGNIWFAENLDNRIGRLESDDRRRHGVSGPLTRHPLRDARAGRTETSGSRTPMETRSIDCPHSALSRSSGFRARG